MSGFPPQRQASRLAGRRCRRWRRLAAVVTARAYAATRAAVEAIIDAINQNPRVFGERETPTAGRMADLLAQGLRAAYNAVLDLAKQWERDADMFSTTLALVVFGAISSGSQVAGCAQVGDGATGIFIPNPTEPGSFRFHLLAQPDEGEIASTTRFLHQVEPGEWPDRIQVLTLPPDAEAIVLATDGVAADFQPLRSHFGRLYARLRSAVLPLADTEAVASLCQVMQWQRPDSFDDRTLLIIHRPVSMGEAGPPPQE